MGRWEVETESLISSQSLSLVYTVVKTLLQTVEAEDGHTKLFTDFYMCYMCTMVWVALTHEHAHKIKLN